MTLPSPSIPGLPPAEVSIDLNLVRELILQQAPRWAGEQISYVATGWDNEVYRLGNELIIRLPRRELGDVIGHSERQWLPKLVAETGLDIATEIFHGEPTAIYPFTFSVTRYVPGKSAATLERTDRNGYAAQLADYFNQLHQRAVEPRPVSSYRGCPLSGLDENTRGQIALLSPELRAAASGLWQEAVSAPVYAGQPVWLHGDPHPHNTIVVPENQGFRLSGLVDFGDLCTGDPASDLGMAWMHFSVDSVEKFMAEYGVQADDATWLRSRGWALRYSMLTAGLEEGDPLGAVGRQTLKILLA
ncbi:phosphotransferase [Glutamicibacter uratoxydans]|uniref:Phosphotransferase n=1 Tax=Glutamicibacter uratoxydans TaxID=43667 RepID=A0A4Y4DTJ2_GLUUR|nr:aminoglycoside phosphotransferase family protein [Glutamicibacter uratoxydans]GED06915.1 phosphotransferase [Glutamicibacter uratoxydans]